ncbi:MAG TPA: SDR family NAD(P)-dependent oxidoreductase [Actinomycetales bacterium]|nr:SDR family NAD(P)-dependent oxidoreductase [Actinomycetales bacterium]
MENQSVLITGAGIGIGAACAQAFAKAGYRVVLTDVLVKEGQATTEALRQAGYDAEFAELDVTDSDQAAAVVQQTQRDGFSAVIANAGIAKRQPFESMTDTEWNRTIEINLNGSMRVFRAAVPAMVERGGGSLISLSSISGVAYGWGEHVHYSSSKAAVIGLARALAVEFGSKNIRSNAIAPGFIRTAQSLDPKHSLGEEGLRQAVSAVPLGRVGEPDEVADVALFLASDAARYVTGQVIVVDGGLLVRQG